MSGCPEELVRSFPDRLHGGKVNLKELLPSELEAFVRLLGESPYRARQLVRWLYVRRAGSFAEMTDLSRAFRQVLEEVAALPTLHLASPEESLQDTTKFLFTLPDGNPIESVRMRYLEHLGPGRLAVCLSSQVGCAMGCEFCASGKSGLLRNLQAWEMVDQVLAIQRLVDPRGERVANVVFMGIGEPLHNFRNLLRAIRILNHGDGLGIGMRHIAISTSGVVPAIRRLAEKRLPLKLAVSLHATRDDLRDRLMPVNRRWKIQELLAACRDYQAATGRRMTFEYVMLEGVNDSLEEADRLVELLGGIRSLVNLIPWNPVDHPFFRRSSKSRVQAFQDRVQQGGLRCTVRREKGSDIDAACGQLRLREIHRHADGSPRAEVPLAPGAGG